MKTKIYTFIFLLTAINLSAQKIQHIFIDIAAVVTPSSSAATKYVGAFNGAKYLAWKGHIPSKKHFFNALQNVPAKSKDLIYNENLVMPAIFSDWLAGLQSNNAIKNAIYNHLDKSKLSKIEKTVYKNIANMMLTPSSLIDTQTIVKHIAEIVQSLQNQGYTVYLIGNWDKESERLLINLLENHSLRNIKTFFSHSIKKVKPTNDYYQNLLSKFALEPESCLMIDVEHQHTHAARQAKINNIIVINNHNSADLKNQLATYSIWI